MQELTEGVRYRISLMTNTLIKKHADAMTDHEKVYETGKMFLRRLQQYLNNQSDFLACQKAFKRITVAEPQGEKHNNSWHLHILLIFEDVDTFI